MGTWLGKGNDPRYTPTTTFETFPIPGWSLAQHARQRIPSGTHVPRQSLRPRGDSSNCATAGSTRQSGWSGSRNPSRAIPGVRSRVTTRLRRALKKRTLTNLYNARPQWLVDAHAQLDAAVAAAYGWPADITNDAVLTELIARNWLGGTSAGESAAL